MTKKLKNDLIKIIISLVLFALLIFVEHTVTLPSLFDSHWVMMLLYLIPYLIAGWAVVRKCFIGISHLQMFDESFLMVIATIGAFVTGQNSEAVAVILFYQVGEFFQQYAVGRSRDSIKALMTIAPDYAYREEDGGDIVTIDPDEVEIGDTLIIKAGDKVPVDGTVISGESMVNTSALTGESVPRSLRTGDSIISGCVNGEGVLKIRADKKYEDSTVAQILDLVENASSKKSKTEQFITRFAKYYTPIVVIGAVFLAVIPSLIYGNWTVWMLRACTFLVISCPCALVISVPLSFFGGIGLASKEGILVKGSNYLEAMAHPYVVVSDKTGTLTKGEFKVGKVLCAEGVSKEELLLKAAIAEGMSTHPIALSIKAECDEKKLKGKMAEDNENVSGKGIKCTIAGKSMLVGNARLLRDEKVVFKEDETSVGTIVYVAEDSKYIGTIVVSDAVKPEAHDAIRDMRNAGVHETVMLTGDNSDTADAVANDLGIDTVYSELLPVDKVKKVEDILESIDEKSRKTKRVIFIGDGINDAPVLTRADVGIAMGSLGSDAAIEAADVVIMDDKLTKVATLIRIARKTICISKQNIAFALTIKAIFLILGAFGYAGMWAAVFADVGVAVICILNSMRMIISKKGKDVV